MKQHKTTLTLIAAAVTACSVYSGYRWVTIGTIQTTDDAYIHADSVMISPRVAGQISVVSVDDNQPVHKGQLLAQLDDRDFRAAQLVALAEVESAKAHVNNVVASIDRQTAVIHQAAAKIASTLASLKYAHANASRYSNLSASGAGTEQEKQKSESELKIWQAARDKDQATHQAAVKALEVLKAELQASRAAESRSAAALEQANLNLSYTTTLAPADGIVAQRTLRQGAFVHAGASLMAVVPLSESFVVANFRETQLAHMNPNQTVQLTVDGFPDHTFTGHVESIAPATGLSFSPIRPDNATGNFTKVTQRVPVKILLDQHQPDLGRLRVGMSVVANVETGADK